MEAIMFIGLIFLVFGFLGGTFSNVPNKPVDGLPRFIFWVGLNTVVGGLVASVTNSLFGGLAAAGAVVLTTPACLIYVSGNVVALGVPAFGGKTLDSGLIAYRIFKAGLRFKYPWEKIELNVDVNKDIKLSKNVTIEFIKGTGNVTLKATIQADIDQIQQFVTIGKDEKSRDEMLSGLGVSTITSIVTDFMSDKEMKAVRADKVGYCDRVLRERRAQIEAFQSRFGVKLNGLVIEDVDFSDEVKKAFEQTLVQEHIRKAARKVVTRGKDFKTLTPQERLAAEKWAHDQVMARIGAKDLRQVEFLGEASQRTRDNAQAAFASEKKSGKSGGGK